MRTVKGLAMIALLFGGTSLAVAQSGPPTGGQPPVAGGRSGQPRQPGTARTGRHAGRSGTQCSIRGAKPVSALGRATFGGHNDNPRCASSHDETPQTHVHVGQGHASQDAQNRTTTHQAADETVNSFDLVQRPRSDPGPFFSGRTCSVKRAANATARAPRRFCRPPQST
jgi:hypothetical protein